jgi:hypothetical protein
MCHLWVPGFVVSILERTHMKSISPLLALLLSLFLAGCGAPGSSHSANNNQHQDSGQGQSTGFPANTEFVYLSAPHDGQVYGFRLDTTSGSLSPVPGSPFIGPTGIRGFMFLCNDKRILVSIGEDVPSVIYSVDHTSGSLTQAAPINFYDDSTQDLRIVAMDGAGQFMYGITGYRAGNGTLRGVRISDGSAVPGLGMTATRVVSHPDQRTLYLDGRAYTIDENTGTLSRSTSISDLPTKTGQLTPDGLTFVTQVVTQSAATHVYHRSSLASSFVEETGSPINIPAPGAQGWYLETSGTYVYIWDQSGLWYGYRLDTLAPVSANPFPDFAFVDNSGKFALQTDGNGSLRIQHYDSSTGMYGSTIGTYPVPSISNVRFIVGAD